MERREYSTPQASKVTRVPLREIINSIERGLITPEYALANGHGSKRILSLRNLMEIVVLRELRLNGFNRLKDLQELMSALQQSEFGEIYGPETRLGNPYPGLDGLRQAYEFAEAKGMRLGGSPPEREYGPKWLKGHVGTLAWLERSVVTVAPDKKGVVRVGPPIRYLYVHIAAGVPPKWYSVDEAAGVGVDLTGIRTAVNLGVLEAEVYAAAF